MKRHLLQTVAAWAALAAFMMFSNPEKLPVVVLIVPFLLLFVVLYASWDLVARVKNRFYGSAEPTPKRKFGAAICASLVLIVILQSLGQLTLKDVLTLLAIVSLGYFFLSRNRVQDSRR